MEDNLDSPELSKFVRQFEESEENTQTARRLSERDRDYYDHKQHTADEESALNKRKQPVVTFNRIQRKVNFLLGLETQNRRDPKAFPRNEGGAQSAQAATDGLRYTVDDNDWDDKRSETVNNLIVEGTGVVMVGVKKAGKFIDPSIEHIAWDRFYADPHSSRFDYRDAGYMGLINWMDAEDVIVDYGKEAESVIEFTLHADREEETYEDKPRHKIWADYNRKRVRIVEHYYKKGGVWHFCIFTKGGFLVEPAPSPYLDADGEPECPLKAISLYVDRDNNRYGEVRVMIDPQDEVNKRRSKALHLMNMRQVRIARGAEQNKNQVRQELAKPDGVLVGDRDDIEILNTADMAAHNLNMLAEAKAEIDLLGANAALAGKNENDMSGRAILAQQQGGMVEVAVLLSRIRSLSLDVYRSVWGRIKQHWTQERWVRVMDDEKNPRFTGINQPITFLQAAQERLADDPEGRKKLAILAQDPRSQQVMEVRNRVADLDIDIVIDEGMDTPNTQAEQFETLSKIIPNIVNLPPQYAIMLIQASNLRDKDKIIELLEQMQQAPPPDPMADAMKQITIAGEQAKVEETQSKTAKNNADAAQTGYEIGAAA